MTKEEIIKRRYPFYDENLSIKDIELCGEEVQQLMGDYAKCEIDKAREDIRELIEALRACFKILEQTKIHREAFNLTGGNIFLDSTIDKVEELLKKYDNKKT